MIESFLMDEYPLISCILATKDRQESVPIATDCFQAQLYPNCEPIAGVGSKACCDDVLSLWENRDSKSDTLLR